MQCFYEFKVVVDRLMQLKDTLNNQSTAKNGKIKLSYMPIIIKATSLGLKEFPILNSRLNDSIEAMVYIVILFRRFWVTIYMLFF